MASIKTHYLLIPEKIVNIELTIAAQPYRAASRERSKRSDFGLCGFGCTLIVLQELLALSAWDIGKIMLLFPQQFRQFSQRIYFIIPELRHV